MTRLSARARRAAAALPLVFLLAGTAGCLRFSEPGRPQSHGSAGPSAGAGSASADPDGDAARAHRAVPGTPEDASVSPGAASVQAAPSAGRSSDHPESSSAGRPPSAPHGPAPRPSSVRPSTPVVPPPVTSPTPTPTPTPPPSTGGASPSPGAQPKAGG
ncbi:hypothetical protein [Streptantibioticus ferralitis]|uniref:Uncharacterized protein n=1 Tax=Streptantibioticus ferralitis TaxID=236510 RepID=A0ABT5Z7X6_9ACTN|nr:hypothetical protein [Streptantibioticus ferralitis]MDF2259934.1 hypothetical protein [Streptantibioticus ferralitis]